MANTATAAQPLPSLAQLGKATVTALAVAGVILTTTVLPAEYGIDPIGAGRALGLLKMNAGGPSAAAAPAIVPAAPGAPAAGASTSPVVRTDAAYRSDEMSVTLAPGEGAEIKALIRKGQQFVFNWSTDGAPVKADMHGEPENAKPNEFTTYWKEPQQTHGQGSFTAGFDGIHGWFWRR
ncbi:transmembrane anchor protein [Pseudoduganella sp. UC29_106]|uniref:transmembrane anchor protein n=1 Tax=Pseudoduganella sp. UC29_106 TaxID=3374553 RepID=UPI0037584064